MQYKTKEEVFSAFSLVELMISLITVSLISAAFAPVITKKLSRSMVTVKSAVAAIRSDCEKFNNNGGTCNACIDDVCLLCDIHCSDSQYKNIGKCLCENCSERSEGCLECSSQGCDKCADGYYIDESLKCVKCPKGSKCPDGKKRELCPIGYYQDEEKKSVCKGCLTSNGNYTNEEGSTACLSCVAGQYTVDKNWDWHWDGKEHYGTACATCPAGYYCPDGKSAFGCGNNNYQDETGKTGCKTCPNGKFSPNSPSSSCSSCDGKCTACYQSATNCSSCTSGNYLSGSSCNSCPANATCDGSANWSCNSGYTLSNSVCERRKISSQSDCDSVGANLLYIPAEYNDGGTNGVCVTRCNLGDCGFPLPYVDGIVLHAYGSGTCTNNRCCWNGQGVNCVNNTDYSGCGRTVCTYPVAVDTCKALSYGTQGAGKWSLPTALEAANWVKYQIHVQYQSYGLNLCGNHQTDNYTDQCLGTYNCNGTSASSTIAHFESNACLPFVMFAETTAIGIWQKGLQGVDFGYNMTGSVRCVLREL